eukprot:9606392-Heterocapsa_arctica.AAC.1
MYAATLLAWELQAAGEGKHIGKKHERDEQEDKTYIELARLGYERRRYREDKWFFISKDSRSGDITGKFIHRNIWAQRLTGKRPEQNPKRKCRSTKDGGMVHGECKNTGRTKEGEDRSERGAATRAKCGAHAERSDAPR